MNARALAVSNMTEEEVADWVRHAMAGTLDEYLRAQTPPPPPSHGLSGYNYGCRCAVCRAARTEKAREHYRRMRARGGARG